MTPIAPVSRAVAFTFDDLPEQLSALMTDPASTGSAGAVRVRVDSRLGTLKSQYRTTVIGGALLAMRAIESFLFQTAPTDAVTLAIVAGTLMVTGCLVALLPSLRAARVDPAVTLRTE